MGLLNARMWNSLHIGGGLEGLLIGLGISSWAVPAMHGPGLHRQPLGGGDAESLVVVIRQLPVLGRIASIPVRGIVAALAPLDADECPGAGEDGEAQLGQAFRHIRPGGLVIVPGIGGGRVPAMETAAQHGLFLCGGDAAALVAVVCHVAVQAGFLAVVLCHLPASTPGDTNQSFFFGQDREAHIRESLREVGVKAVLLRHDTPVIAVPQMDVQLTAITNIDIMLLEALSPAVRHLSAEIVS